MSVARFLPTGLEGVSKLLDESTAPPCAKERKKDFDFGRWAEGEIAALIRKRAEWPTAAFHSHSDGRRSVAEAEVSKDGDDDGGGVDGGEDAAARAAAPRGTVPDCHERRRYMEARPAVALGIRLADNRHSAGSSIVFHQAEYLVHRHQERGRHEGCIRADDRAVILEALEAAQANKDLEGMLSLFASDVLIESPLVSRVMNRKEGICRGREELRVLARALLEKGVPWGVHAPPLIRNTAAVEYMRASSRMSRSRWTSSK